MTQVWIDVETGGLDPARHSLLTLALIIEGPGHGRYKSLEIAFRHDSYVVDVEALRVNRIDLNAHHASALAPEEAAERMEAFLDRHAGDGVAIQLAGHNVGFDRAFLKAWLERHAPHLVRRFSHRTVDTYALASALQAAGRIPEGSLSLSALSERFGVCIASELRHTARGDAMAALKLFRCISEELAKGA